MDSDSTATDTDSSMSGLSTPSDTRSPTRSCDTSPTLSDSNSDSDSDSEDESVISGLEFPPLDCGPFANLGAEFELQKLTNQEKATLVENSKDKDWLAKLNKDLEAYNVMKDQVVEEMENQTDPIFKRFLSIYKSTLTPTDFHHNRLIIYGLCNKHAITNCLSIDELMSVFGPNDY